MRASPHCCIVALVHWCIGALVHRCIGALGILGHYDIGVPANLLGELVPQRVVGAHEEVRRDLAQWLLAGGHGAARHRLGDARLLLLPLAQQVLGLTVGVAHLGGALGHWCMGAFGVLVHWVHWCIGTSVDALVHWAIGALVH